MPSVLASPSPIRRYGGTYSTYTSSSAYSRSSTSYGGRTSSLDRSSYSSYVSSYKYGSGTSSSSKDYSSRPPIGSGAIRNTTVVPSSIYSSSRVSPARSYLSRKSTSIEDGTGATAPGSSSSLRNRETQSESREGNNNTYTNGNVRRGVRDYSAYSPTSSSSTSTLSKYRTSPAVSSAIRSKYGDYSDTSKSTEATKGSERVRGYQSSREPVFQSRFLRSRQDNAATSSQTTSTAKSEDKTSVNEEAEEEVRPSVAELRRRYDQNRNDVSAAKEAAVKPAVNVRSPSESESEDSSDRETIRSSVSPVKPPPPPPLPPPVAASTSSAARRVRKSPDRIASNGPVDGKETTKSRPEAEDNKSIHQVSNDTGRSSSPSTLSSSSDGESQDNVSSSAVERRTTVRSRAAASTAASSRAAATSRNSISDSDSESLSKSPKLSAARRAKLAASAAAVAAAATSSAANSLERQGLVGFRNIGNTCFMNSVLQCLSNTRVVLEYVLNDDYVGHINTTISSMNGALIKAFASVISELWKQEDDEYLSGAVNPTALKTQIQKFAPRFMGYNQQDSQEFLRYLLEGLHEDVNRVSVKPKPLEHDIDDNLSDAQKSVESWKRYLRRDDSKIVDLFVGQLKSTLQCTVCGHCSVTFDPFWDLSLPIPPTARSSSSSVKVQQCLDLFTKEEILDGDEKPTCSKCQARRKCTKAFSIQKFPQILVLHLKRFSPGERFRKLDASVDFPLTELDLSAYSAAGLKPTPCSYQLYGVINHSGTAYSGHYTAFCRHPYSNTWHEYNDSRVTNISPQRVVSPEAYLLFYEMESLEARL